MIRREKSLLQNNKLSGALLRGVLAEHEREVGRMNRLYDYYALRSPINLRTRPEGLPNNRLSHAYARYVVNVAAGYLTGSPVTYQDDTQKEALQPVINAYRAADVQSVDMELSRAQSLFGKGVELIYADKNVRPRSAALDPRCAFVVYDSTVAAEPLFGVLYRPITDESGRPTAHELNVYLEDSILTYRATNLLDLGSKAPDSVERHYFGRVPLIEYWNNDEETGDFECVLSLLDAYDAVQSDRLNDEEQLVNALLVITGAQLLPDEKGRSPAQQLRQDKLLYLPDRDASAQYLTRPNASADAETLRLALKSDIHKLCMVPDLSDEHFAGNASGVAMRYKLLGLEQLTRIKERWFREALRERLRIYARFLSVKGYRPLNADTVRMVFERSLPQDALETAQMVKTLEGMVPEDVLMSQLPFVEK